MADADDKPVIDVPAVLTDSDYGLAPKSKILSTADLRRLGAFTLEAERSLAVDDHLRQQRKVYEDSSREELIDALVRRDEQALHEGRQLADGRIGGRLLREFVRGVLATADGAALRQVEQGAKGQRIEQILEALGAEAADNRQLKIHGHTLGTDAEAAKERAEWLADGRLIK